MLIKNLIAYFCIYFIFDNLYTILTGLEEDADGLPENMNVNDLVYFKYYVLINSVNVEHSCSTYTNILISNRQSFKIQKKMFDYSTLQ